MFKKYLLLFFCVSFFAINAQNNNFVSTWNVSSGAFELPLKDFTDITIDWGDGTSTAHTNSTFPTHTYGSSDTFTITVTVNDVKKDIGSMYMNGDHASRAMIQDVSNWGEGIWNSFTAAFEGATNLTVSATDEPDLSATTSMLKAFRNCSSLVGITFNDWNVSAITNMEQLFSGTGGPNNEDVLMIFNGDISGWNTAAVTNMRSMFYQCIAFNVGGTQNLNNWNTAAVTNMRSMFNVYEKEGTLFNANISSWNTAKVTNMRGMFQNRTNFNRDISRWNTGAVTNMSYMFLDAYEFNSDISNWNTTAVTKMNLMFCGAQKFNQNINTNGDHWNTAAVIDMSYMFYDAYEFNSDISNWNTAKVTNMSYMFYGAYEFNQNINRNGDDWNTGAVTNMSYMFYHAGNFNGDIKNWNTSNVTDMQNMFAYAYSFNNDITAWNTSSVTNMQSMFENAYAFNQNISTNGDSWNTANVTDMKWMFYYAENFDGDIKNWDTSNVTDMELMFYGAHAFKDKVTTVFDTWDTEKAKETAEKSINPSFSPFNSKLVFKKYFKYLLGLIVLSLIIFTYLFRKKFISINKKKVVVVFKSFILKNTWSMDPITTDLSEIEKKIAKLYPKNKVIEIIHVFEKHIFEDSMFKQQGVNIKEFSKLTGVPLRHCYYIFKTHVNYPFTKFKNYSRIEASLRLIESNYLLKGTFESLSLEVGFDSYGSFYSYFKEYTSMAPSDYMLSRKS